MRDEDGRLVEQFVVKEASSEIEQHWTMKPHGS